MTRKTALLVRLVLVVAGAMALLWWYFERRAWYEDVERRIDEAAPAEGDGLEAAAVPPPRAAGSIRIDVLPRTSEEPGVARYWIQLGETAWDVAFPTEAATAGVREGALELLDRTMRELRDEIERRVPAGGRAPAVVLRQPRDSLASVPPALMTYVLDAITAAGVEDITLEATTQVAPGESPR